MSSKRRKWFRVLASVVLAIAFILVVLPLWFPWVLRPAARRWGASYTRYERVGYQRFRLTDLSIANGSGRFQAEQVEGFVPTIWVWRRWFGVKSEPFLIVNSWNWQSVPLARSRPAGSAYQEVRQAETQAGAIRSWLPKAELANGTIRIKNSVFRVPRASLAGGTLSATVTLPEERQTFALLVAAKSDGSVGLRLDSSDLDLHVSSVVAARGRTLDLEGTIDWLTNRIELSASFPRHGHIPDRASVRTDSFVIPARLLRLPGYSDLAGSLRADWITNRYTLNLTARASPQQPTNLPPLDIELRSAGDTNSAQIDLARISTPWLKVELVRPTRIRFQPPFLLEPATLYLDADLGRQPWFAAQGRLTGRAVFLPDGQGLPRLQFSLTGSDIVAVSNIAAKSIQLEGGLVWPEIGLTRAQLEMADGSHISLTGYFDVRQKVVRDGRLNFSGGFGRQFLPPNISFRTASIAAQFSGPLKTMTNSANFDVDDLVLPRTRPLQLKADWTGRGGTIQTMDIALASGGSSLRMRGAAELGKDSRKLEVTSLDLTRSNRTELQLEQPFQVLFKRTGNAWALDLQPMQWLGDRRALRLQAGIRWPEEGAFQASARGLDSSLVEDFLQGRTPQTGLQELSLSGGWTNGPVSFGLKSKAEVTTQERVSFLANAEVTGGTGGIVIEQLSISSATQAVCRAQGSLPVVLEPGSTNGLIHFGSDRPLHLEVVTEPDSVLWEKMSIMSGLVLREPDLRVHIDGPMSAPQGQITMRAASIQFSGRASPLPALEHVEFRARLDREKAQISQLEALVEGQPVSLTAELPLGRSFWSSQVHWRELPDWRGTTAQLKIQSVRLAPLAVFLPEQLSPDGTVSADIRLLPGGMFDGEVSVRGARTRPLGQLGPVRGIQANVRLAGHEAVLTNFFAEVGGEPITASGRMVLDERIWQTNGLPLFQVHLHGTNVPLVRTSDLLLRADVDLAVTNAASQAPIIIGAMQLRQSLYLADLQKLVPANVVSPKLRPPFFSVEAEPWAGWGLKVSVTGEGFMRVQTPFFNGTASTALALGGTLKDPIALGEVKIDSGTVTFPFGRLDVKQGFVYLTSENPFHPQLFVTASAQRLGYEVRMQATGPADAPVIQFSSSPPLSSEQIVAMLTTGQVPFGSAATATTQTRAQGFALFLGRNLLSDLGFWGGQGRLIVRSGEQISETGRQTYEATYRLTDKWALVGEYDRFDQYNLNLKWRVYSR